MLLVDHVSITSADLDRATPFWRAIMATLDGAPNPNTPGRLAFGTRNRPGDDGHSYFTVLPTRGVIMPDNRHWCFRAPDRAVVDGFHTAGLVHGGLCDGPPGLRTHYHPAYYAAFLTDPDGNRLEAVCHAP